MNFVSFDLCHVAGLKVLTVATDETDGFRRFMRTANKYQLNVKVGFITVTSCTSCSSYSRLILYLYACLDQHRFDQASGAKMKL